MINHYQPFNPYQPLLNHYQPLLIITHCPCWLLLNQLPWSSHRAELVAQKPEVQRMDSWVHIRWPFSEPMGASMSLGLPHAFAKCFSITRKNQPEKKHYQLKAVDHWFHGSWFSMVLPMASPWFTHPGGRPALPQRTCNEVVQAARIGGLALSPFSHLSWAG